MIKFLGRASVAGLMVAAFGCGEQTSIPPTDASPASTTKAAPASAPDSTAKTQPLSKTKVID